MGVILNTIHRIYLKRLGQSWNGFVEASMRPENIQLDILKKTLQTNENSIYGKGFQFSNIHSYEDYKSKVPIVDYDELQPWIERSLEGESHVLTCEPIKVFEKSGGSSASNKFIPYTDGLFNEFSQATNPWMYDMYTSFPSLQGTKSYWSISPASQKAEVSPGGIPIGIKDDTEYLTPLEAWAMKKTLAVPTKVKDLEDIEEWRNLTCKHLINCEDLGLISVWSPSFLTLLLEHIETNVEYFLKNCRKSRATVLEKAFLYSGEFNGEVLWPQLRLVSCWGDGPSKSLYKQLRKWFPFRSIQAKGLLATEGSVSIPIRGAQGAVAAVTGHFLEFLDLNSKNEKTYLSHELQQDGEYSPILTTRGGFYRYHLKDAIRCTGHFNRLPVIEFIGKADRVSDLRGEKLNARQIESVLSTVCRQLQIKNEFMMLVPVDHNLSPHYQLFVENSKLTKQQLGRMGELLEEYLCESHHYNYCRQLKQLGKVKVSTVKNGWKKYYHGMQSLGAKAGDIKPTLLDHRMIWQQIFTESL